ncbi:MAG: HAD family hydrolase [Candidatus Natronoplasma sp.]
MQKLELEEIEVIFFDLDDTLFDQQKAYKIALCQIKNRYQVFDGVDMDDIAQAFEEADSEAIEEFRNSAPMKDLRWNRSERFLKKVGVSEDFTETFHRQFYNIYPSIPVEIKGAKKLVEYLNSKYELGILTNSTEEIQMQKLRALELTEYFDTYVFSEEVGSRKPDEDIFYHSIDLVDKSSARCLYVGNSFRTDVKGAKKVGMRTCWLNRYGEEKVDGPAADIEIKQLRELLDILA